MKADYKNWVPNGMIYGFGATTAGLVAVAGVVKSKPISALLGAGAQAAEHSRHGAFMPISNFPMTENANCPSRSWKVRLSM